MTSKPAVKVKKKDFTNIRKEKREKIVAQALQEIEFARNFKRGKTGNWGINEELYYGNLPKPLTSRSNVDLARMQEFVHTLLSKIDTPLVFKFAKRKDAQAKRVEQLNALREFDADRDYWDIKDIAAKKQMVIYGRAMFSYAASSDGGVYEGELQNVDVYNFLIDPSAGGIDIEKARYVGDYGVTLSRQDLKAGATKGLYIKEEVDLLIEGNGNSTETTQEKNWAKSRTQDAQRSQQDDKEISDKDKFILWRWGTTYEGERYYLLLSENGSRAIRVVKANELFGARRWWYWTYAAYPDLTEFWTPSPCDYVREIFMAQAVSINQMLDNAEQINKPQKVVDVSAVKNMAKLKYRRDGIIEALPGQSQNAIKILETPSINTPIQVFNILEAIQQRASGVTDTAAGVADTDGRATIYEGNREATADRFGLFNKSYTFGYKQFARLWEWGVRDHMIRRMSIDVNGPEGISLMDVSRRDLFKSKMDNEFGLIVESSNSELVMSAEKKRLQAAFLGSLYGNPDVDQKDLIMALGEIAGVDTQTMRQILDKSEYGDSHIRGEAARDLEALMDGDNVKPNRIADTAYMKYIVDYMRDNEENLDGETFAKLVQYIEALKPIVVQNMTARAQEQIAKNAEAQMGGGNGAQGAGNGLRAPGRSQPLQDVIQQNVN